MKKLIILSAAILMMTAACGQADNSTIETKFQAVNTPAAKATNAPLPAPTAATTLSVESPSASPLRQPVSPVDEPATEIGGAMDTSTRPDKMQKMIEKSKEMLVDLLGNGLKAEEITVVSAESREWRDGSLGCPQPGMMYTQAITSGYLIVLEVEGHQYEFHTDKGNAGVLCKVDGKPAWEVLKQ